MIFTISLTQNKDFLKLYKTGKYISSAECVVYFKRNGLAYNRLGITTGKKIGNAVCRNRARRVIRAAYQQKELEFPVGYDIVIVARKSACEVKSHVISSFFSKRVIKYITKVESGCQKCKQELQ